MKHPMQRARSNDRHEMARQTKRQSLGMKSKRHKLQAHPIRVERVKHDEDAPLELHFVGIHEAFDRYLHKPPYHTYRTELTGLSHPCRRKKLSHQSPCAASELEPCASARIHESDRWDSSGRLTAARR